MRGFMENSRLHKTLKHFWRNGSCTQYQYRKRKTGISRKDVHFTRLYVKPYWRHIPQGKHTQKMYRDNP